MESHLALMQSPRRRAGRAEYDLPYPDSETEPPDHADGDDRPDSKSQNQEGDEFAPALPRMAMRYGLS